MATETRKQDLRHSHIFRGQVYTPGAGVVVPADFPEDADAKVDARNSVHVAQSPVGASGSGVEQTSDLVSASGHVQGFNKSLAKALSEDELNEKSKDELLTLAASKGVEVSGTGANGNVTKADLVSALKAPESETTEETA